MTSNVANIDIGSLPNDGTGDPLRVAFAKINDNFTYLGNLVPGGPAGALQYIDANGFFEGSSNIVFDTANNQLDLGTTIVPLSDAGIDLGTSEDRIGNLYLANTFQMGNISISESGNLISFPVTVLPSKQASLHVNDVTMDGNLTVGGSLTLTGVSIGGFNSTTTGNTQGQVIFQMPLTQFDTGIFQITSRDSNSANSQTVTLSVTKYSDNSNVRFSAYGTVFVGNAITSYNVDNGYGNVRILINPLVNDTITHVGTFDMDPV
jgi:hypothetical protein